MKDAVALLAISQLVCLGAIFYLYTQVHALRSSRRYVRRTQPSARVRPIPGGEAGAATTRAARAAYAGSATAPVETLATRVGDGGVDVAALALRMRKSEEEVRLLLRRKGIAGR